MLALAARHGRWCLIAGLAAGLALPGLAEALRPYLPVMISALLFLAAFRVGPKAVWGGDSSTLLLVTVYQVLAPLAVLGIAHLAGVAGTSAALAAVLVMAAPSVTGSPNFAILMGLKPDAALQLLLLGTALLPVTVLPVLALLPDLDTRSVLSAAGRLIAVVALSGGVAFWLRRGRLKDLTDPQRTGVDGASAILLGVVVIGLMSAAGPMLINTPLVFAGWLAFATAVNFSAQLIAWVATGSFLAPKDRGAVSIVAGNRNIALFLVALPPEITFGLLSFIGCYQIPMYLTPILFGRLYRKGAA